MSGDHPLIRMLTAFDARVNEMTAALADASHDFELPEAGADAWTAAHAHGLRMRAARSLWFAEPVPLAAFLDAGNRIAILAPDLLRRVLAARTLFGCRDAVRRCVERRVRATLADSVGTAALAALSAVPVGVGVGAANHTLPAGLAADVLAREGWRRLIAAGACSEPALCNLVELSLAAASDGAQSDDSRTTGFDDSDSYDSGSLNSTETQHFFSAAGGIFPELQWLFG